MKETHLRLLKQFSEMASEGKFGDLIKITTAEYNNLSDKLAIFIKVVSDFYKETTSHKNEIAPFRDMICQLLITAYREACRADPVIAASFLQSFTSDFPDVPESSLLPKWCSLAQASLALREVAQSENRLLIWQQSLKEFQAYSEFLNGLLAYLIILLRTTQGKPIKAAVFDAPYSSKVEEFVSLTGGESGPFYLFCRLAKPKVRNAIAHETLWLDSEKSKIRYTEGRFPRSEYEMDLVEFYALVAFGSHLAHSYLAAISAIVVMEAGNTFEKHLLPPHLVRIFTYRPKSSMK